MPFERISQLETRADGADHRLDDHHQRLKAVEGQVLDVRLGMKDLHADLNLNTAATREVKEEVRGIKQDTTQMLAEYRAKPAQRAEFSWWMKVVAAVWAALMAVGTVLQAIAALKG